MRIRPTPSLETSTAVVTGFIRIPYIPASFLKIYLSDLHLCFRIERVGELIGWGRLLAHHRYLSMFFHALRSLKGVTCDAATIRSN